MPRKYTKMEMLAEEVFRRKEAGETNRQNRKKRALENGYVPLPKGRPLKDSTPETEETKRNNELVVAWAEGNSGGMGV